MDTAGGRYTDIVRLPLVILGLIVGLSTACGLGFKPSAKKYTMQGKVLSLDEQSHLAKIDAGKIGDWMGPMTMDYPIPNRSDWQQLKPGVTIDASVFVRGDEYWVADVHAKAP